MGAGGAHVLELPTLEQLSSLGQHRAAITLLSTAVNVARDAEDALQAQRLLLAEGRVGEALQRARSDAAALAAHDGVLPRLMQALLSWCIAHDCVQQLLALPLTPAEEAAVLETLAPSVVEATCEGVREADAVVGYLLGRGRVPEALLMAGRVDAAVARGGMWF